MSERPTVLVTGVGAIIGYGILKSLRRSHESVRLVGMDIFADAYGRSVADAFVQAARANDDAYVEFVRRVVTDQGIDLIIPGIEQDLYALWNHRSEIPTRIVLNNDLCLRLSQSKLDTWRYLSRLDLPFVIPTLFGCSYVECVARFGLPFVLKPVSSYAGKGLSTIRSAREFEFQATRAGAGAFICQKLIGTDDEEYTVGVFGNGRGGYADSIILRRRLSQEGATQKAWFVPADGAISNCVDIICSTLKPVGPTNIQVRKDRGQAFLLEINPRISSACSIRTMMGYNEPEMCVRYFLRGELPVATEKHGGAVTRFIDDCRTDG